jgi:tungstate transport system substrate-binding protein
VVLAFTLLFSIAACAKEDTTEDETTVEEPAVETTKLILASTTSTQDSGLFDVLIPAFEEAYPQYKVEVIAVGTGEALELGMNKDADVLLVHAKAKEEQFVADGYGTERHDVMYNDFIIVGPASDPAGIKGMTVAADAFLKIEAAGATFISRGDNSGTHTKEMSIWKAAGETTPTAGWYQSAGQGMGDVLTMASEQGAYTLADRATFLSMEDQLDLEILVEGDTALYNQYGVIPVTDATNFQGAEDFMNWILSDEGQEVINTYGVEEYGQALFIGNPS